MVMRSFYILSFLICLLGWGACKHDTPATQESATSAAAAGTPAERDTINPPPMESSSQRPASQAPANNTPTPAKTGTAEVGTNLGHDYTFLTYKMFKINGAFVPGKDPKEQPYKDQWVDLLSDGTYKWGKGKDQLYTGTWGYNHDVRVLDLKPNDRNEKQTEWNVIFNDDMVVLTGTNAFDNGGIQLQLIRVDQMN
jgi:hypothetical protein